MQEACKYSQICMTIMQTNVNNSKYFWVKLIYHKQKQFQFLVIFNYLTQPNAQRQCNIQKNHEGDELF